MNVLVIPSNRQEQLSQFFDAWRGMGGWDRVVLIDDHLSRVLDHSRSDRPVDHFSHAEVAAELKDKAWIISRKDSACRCFGFLKAWQMGAECVLTLDDDVRPVFPHCNIFQSHEDRILRTSRFQTSAVGLTPRGMPSVEFPRADVRVSVGLWQGVPDMWAEDMLLGFPTNWKPPLGTRLLADGEFVPICGMNFCVHRDAVPLCWFPLMGEGQPFGRFDDIWMGLILKASCDAMGWKVSMGEPFIRHDRASNPRTCADRERSGKGAVNNALWLWFSDLSLWGSNPVDVMAGMGERLTRSCQFPGGGPLENLSKEVISYLSSMGRGMVVWASLFRGG